MNELMRRRRALMSGVESLDPNTIYGRLLTWEMGSFNSSDGTTVTESDRVIHTVSYIPIDSEIALTFSGNRLSSSNIAYSSNAYCYDSSYNFLGITDAQELYTAQDVTSSPITKSGTAYVRFTFAVPAGNTITTSAGADFAVTKSTPSGTHKQFSLVNRVVTAGAQIGCMAGFLSASYGATVLLDFDNDANITSGYGNAVRFIHVYNNALSKVGYSFGKSSSTSGLAIAWMGSSMGGISIAVPVGRFRVAVTHAANSGTITTYIKIGTDAVQTKTKTGTYTASEANWINFGNGSNANGSLTNGTVNKGEIYRGVLSTAEINAFFA